MLRQARCRQPFWLSGQDCSNRKADTAGRFVCCGTGPALWICAEELKLDWDTVKTLEKQYMQAQLARITRHIKEDEQRKEAEHVRLRTASPAHMD
jgi:uncharacterized hydantoinase/oxoprolinase family protein